MEVDAVMFQSGNCDCSLMCRYVPMFPCSHVPMFPCSRVPATRQMMGRRGGGSRRLAGAAGAVAVGRTCSGTQMAVTIGGSGDKRQPNLEGTLEPLGLSLLPLFSLLSSH